METARRFTLAGLWGLPVYGLATFVSTLTHQPDPNTRFRQYAEFVSSSRYLLLHLFGSIGGTTLAILGTFALGAWLARGRAPRLGLTGMVLSVVGLALIMAVFGMSTFATPAVGRAFLAGQTDVVSLNRDIIGVPLIATALLGGLSYAAGSILLGIAVWKSGDLPRWAGVLYAPTGLLIAIVGLVVGVAQTPGALLVIVAGTWIALAARRSRPALRAV